MSDAASTNKTRTFRFGVFEFHAGSLNLSRQGTPIRLQTQPARLLRLLLSKAGEVVSRDEIYQSLWDEGITVDFEMAVNRCIRQLREALGDDSDAPRYIRTIPRFGYCFIAATSTDSLVAPKQAGSSVLQQIASQPSIAVLPLANLSSNTADEYFSDGLTEEITNVLAQISGLKVIARTSAFVFKGKNEDVRTIAKALGVSNVLEGSVRRSGTRIRVTVQLIRASDGSHCLSKRYDSELKDVFALEDEIASDVAQELRFHLGVNKRSTENVLAHQAYLEGRFHWHKFVVPAFKRALQCFERAIAIDPGYAAAYTGVSQCFVGLVQEGGAPALNFLPKAKAAAQRALELNDLDAEAHASLGEVAALLDYDWPQASKHFESAVKLNPTSYVRMAYALWYLVPQGSGTEALAQTNAVLELDPLGVPGHQMRAAAFFFLRDYEEGAKACLRVLELDETFPRAIQTLSLIRGYQSRFAESIALAERLVQVMGKTPIALYTLGTVKALTGNLEAGRLLRNELEGLPYTFATGLGLLSGTLGDQERAFHWFHRAIEIREPTMLWLSMLPAADRVRSNMRFKEVLQQMNLTVEPQLKSASFSA